MQSWRARDAVNKNKRRGFRQSIQVLKAITVEYTAMLNKLRMTAGTATAELQDFSKRVEIAHDSGSQAARQSSQAGSLATSQPPGGARPTSGSRPAILPN